MEKTIINVKTDRNLKQDAQKVARELGLPLGTIINAYLRKLTRDKRVVFWAPPTPNKQTQKMLAGITANKKKVRRTHGPFTYSEAIEHLADL